MKIIQKSYEIVKNLFIDIKDMIIWIKNKELIEEQIKIDSHKIDMQQIEIGKLKNKIKKLEDKDE